MISDNEFQEILQGLYQKTAKDGLVWQSAPRSALIEALSGIQGPSVYYTQLPKSVIKLEYGSPPAEPDFIVFTIARDLGAQIFATRKVYEGDFGWEPLSDLYALIMRRHLGWDEVYKGVRDFLVSPTAPAVASQKGP